MARFLRMFAVVGLCFCLAGCNLEDIKQKLGLSDEEAEAFALGNNLVLDFGTVAVGSVARQEYTIYGVSLLGYEIVKFGMDEGGDVFALANNTCSKPGEETDDACVVGLIFQPKDATEYQGRLSVWGRSNTGEGDSDDLSKLGEIILRGVGGRIVLSVSPLAYDWGQLDVLPDGKFAGADVGISVRSGVSARIGRVQIGDGFVVAENGCAGVDLSQGCVIRVRPDVREEGEYTGTLRIEPEDRFIAAAEVSLKATAKYTPSVAVEPKSIQWNGTIEKDGKSVTLRETVRIANTGFSAVSVKSAAVEVEAADSGAVPMFSVSNRCQDPLGAGESCELVLSGTFADGGKYYAALVISFDAVKTVYVPITASIVKSSEQSDNQTKTGDAISVSPASYAFPDTRVGESVQATFSVTNKTESGLALQWQIDSDFGGDNGTSDNETIPAFKIASVCYQIEPQKTCQATVMFTPGTVGEYSAQVTISAFSGTDVVGTASVTLTGKAVAAQPQSVLAEEIGMVVRYAIPLDRWGRAPTDVYVVVDLTSAQAAGVYDGTTFYVDGVEVLQSETMTGAVPVKTPGSHVITVVGRTSDGRVGSAHTTVTLVEGDAPQCRLEQYGDGETSLALKAVCTVEMGYIVDYDWTVDGKEVPIDGSIIGFSRNELEAGIRCVEATASTDNGQRSTVQWGGC